MKFFVVVYWNVEQASSSTARQTSRIRETYQGDDQDLGGEISRKRQNQPGKGTSWFRTGVQVITSIFNDTNNFGHQVYLDQAPYFQKSITWMYSYEIMVKSAAIC